MALKLKIITPDGLFVDNKEVDIVNIQSIDGDMGILENMIPLVTALKIGVLSFKVHEQTTYIHVHRGIAKMDGKICTIITERLYLVNANKVQITTPKNIK